MFDRAFNLTTKSLLGEQLTEEEKLFLQARNVRYELVRWLFIDKVKDMKGELKNFHFTPGAEFMDTPVLDTVNSLVEIHRKMLTGEIKPVAWDF